jgi:DNA-binding transcriptional LysR family regulator
MITIKRLRCFVAVAEEGHFNKAAVRLGMSQPPLTEHIRVLEQTLDCRLFERTTRAIKLTAKGQTLLEHAKKILTDVEKTHEVINADLLAPPPELKLGVLHAHTYTFLPLLLRSFIQKHPHVNVQLVEYSTSGQIDTILSSNVDIALVREPLKHANIDVQTLFKEPYVLALPTTLRTASTVDISILEGRPIIGYPSHDDQRSTRSLFRDFLSQHHVQPSAWREVTTMHSALALVCANLGIAPVPLSQTSLQIKGVSYRRVKQPPPQLSVGLAWQRGAATPLAQAFKRFAQHHFASWPIG